MHSWPVWLITQSRSQSHLDYSHACSGMCAYTHELLSILFSIHYAYKLFSVGPSLVLTSMRTNTESLLIIFRISGYKWENVCIIYFLLVDHVDVFFAFLLFQFAIMFLRRTLIVFWFELPHFLLYYWKCSRKSQEPLHPCVLSVWIVKHTYVNVWTRLCVSCHRECIRLQERPSLQRRLSSVSKVISAFSYLPVSFSMGNNRWENVLRRSHTHFCAHVHKRLFKPFSFIL